MIPTDQLSNSWIIVSRATSKPVFETWSRKVAERINPDAYEVLTSYAWLVRFNKQADKRG